MPDVVSSAWTSPGTPESFSQVPTQLSTKMLAFRMWPQHIFSSQIPFSPIFVFSNSIFSRYSSKSWGHSSLISHNDPWEMQARCCPSSGQNPLMTSCLTQGRNTESLQKLKGLPPGSLTSSPPRSPLLLCSLGSTHRSQNGLLHGLWTR